MHPPKPLKFYRMHANKYDIWVLERFTKDNIAFFGRLVLPDPTIGVIEV